MRTEIGNITDKGGLTADQIFEKISAKISSVNEFSKAVDILKEIKKEISNPNVDSEQFKKLITLKKDTIESQGKEHNTHEESQSSCIKREGGRENDRSLEYHTELIYNRK